MAQDKHRSDQHYMEEELAASQKMTPPNQNAKSVSSEQSLSPESMHKRLNTHKGSKSITKGYKG